MAQVLIVDDEEPIRRILARILEPKGYACTLAAGAAEGRAALKEQAYELVLSDIRMPGESGIDFIEYVLSEYPETAALLVSVMGDPEVAERAVELGVYGYILKPFQAGQILVSVANALRRRRLEIENRAHRETLEQSVRERTAALDGTLRQLRLADQELRESEEKYRRLVDNLPAVVYTSYRDGAIDFVDERIETVTGYDVSAFLSGGTTWSDIIHREDIESTRQGFRDALHSSRQFILEYRIHKRNGDIIWIQDRGSIICDRTGRIDYVSGVLFDITDGKRAEEALETEKEKFKFLVENSPVGVSLIGLEGRFKYVNPEFVSLFGYTLEDIPTEKEWFEKAFPDPEYREEACTAWQDETDKSGFRRYMLSTLSVTSKDGAKKTIHFNRVPIDSANQIVIYTDVTEQERAENELRKAHAEMEQLLSAFSSVLIGIDAENRVTRWNRVAEEVFGVRESDVDGRPLQECPINWPKESILNAIASCRTKRVPIRVDDIRFTRSDGKERFLGMGLNPILSGDADPPGVLILASDITERKILESQLAQAQKLESIGQLAAGIAHEINTPTQYVGDNIRFLEEAFSDLLRLLSAYREFVAAAKAGKPPDSLAGEVEDLAEEIDFEYLTGEVPKSIEESLEGVGRVAKIVLAMKEFSHPGTGEKSLIDINKAIESTITVARNEWKYVADLVTDFDASLPPIPCLPGEFNQVVLNVIINAAHAIKDALGDQPDTKGVITVKTRRNREDCEIRISDTGTGIPEAIRRRVFDPFFTTKDVGKGTGQGLALSHGVIVEKHGGSISFETEMGQGTTFIIKLPMGAQEA